MKTKKIAAVPGEETSSEWCETVTDEIYGKLK